MFKVETRKDEGGSAFKTIVSKAIDWREMSVHILHPRDDPPGAAVEQAKRTIEDKFAVGD